MGTSNPKRQKTLQVGTEDANGDSNDANGRGAKLLGSRNQQSHRDAAVQGDGMPTPQSPKVHGDGVLRDAVSDSVGGLLDFQASAAVRPPEERLATLREMRGKKAGEPLVICGIGAGAWGSVFIAMLQDTYGHLKDDVDIRIWRRKGRALDKDTAEELFQVINTRESVVKRLMKRCAYLKYAEARLGERVLYADEVLEDGFCINMLDTPLCPLHVVTNLAEAVWDADIVVNSLPSTEVRAVFEEVGRIWKNRTRAPALVISLAKGLEAGLHPTPHIVTPSLLICQTTGLPPEHVLYLGGPNIAAEVYNREYANARLCGAKGARRVLGEVLRAPHFGVWGSSDIVTHEVMGGLKNVYAIGAGMVAELTRESATSKAVYFAHATSEMVFITHLVSPSPEELAGPLLADTYVTLLKGRNAWYGQQLARGALAVAMGDSVKGKGMIQGVSATAAFFTVLSQPSVKLEVEGPEGVRKVSPVELCPILGILHAILIARTHEVKDIVGVLRDETACDPRFRIALAQRSNCFFPQLVGRHSASTVNEEH